VKNVTKDKQITTLLQISDREREMLLAGGCINLIRNGEGK